MRPSRFTGRQITTIVVAVALAVIAFPIGVVAATASLVTIADPAHPSRQAHVSTTGRLLTTVDGTVEGRPAPPKRPWSYAEQQSSPNDVVLGPTASTVNVTSLTVTSNGSAQFTLTVLFVPGGSTDCNSINEARQVYMAGGLEAGTPLTASFPTPLQARPTSGQKICLVVAASNTTVDLVGYFS
jgi:hypothetical protein